MPPVFRRKEFEHAALDLGVVVELSDYATTGLRAIATGPSGSGKTNAGLVIAEQLAAQGWQVVLMDPEGELAALYPEKILSKPEMLIGHVERREAPAIAVAPVRHAGAFIPYAELLLDVVDRVRKPTFILIDEGQVFSTSRRGKRESIAEATALVNEFLERGRRRALDVFLSAHRFAGTLHRSVFANKNVTLVGRQEDPTPWSMVAPLFGGSGITYPDTAALAPGEFFLLSRRGVEKVALPMSARLRAVAPQATAVRQNRPLTWAQWDQAVRDIPTERLQALTTDAIAFLASLAGLTTEQIAAGTRALRDELRTLRHGA
jgi:hypothetical protein